MESGDPCGSFKATIRACSSRGASGARRSSCHVGTRLVCRHACGRAPARARTHPPRRLAVAAGSRMPAGGLLVQSARLDGLAAPQAGERTRLRRCRLERRRRGARLCHSLAGAGARGSARAAFVLTGFPAPAIARPSSLERRFSAMLNGRVNRMPVTRPARVASTMGVAAVDGADRRPRHRPDIFDILRIGIRLDEQRASGSDAGPDEQPESGEVQSPDGQKREVRVRRASSRRLHLGNAAGGVRGDQRHRQRRRTRHPAGLTLQVGSLQETISVRGGGGPAGGPAQLGRRRERDSAQAERVDMCARNRGCDRDNRREYQGAAQTRPTCDHGIRDHLSAAGLAAWSCSTR